MYKFQVFNISLKSFRQELILPPPLFSSSLQDTHTHTTKWTPKQPTQIRVKRIEVQEILFGKAEVTL